MLAQVLGLCHRRIDKTCGNPFKLLRLYRSQRFQLFDCLFLGSQNLGNFILLRQRWK